MLRYRTGAASKAGGAAVARYLGTETLRMEPEQRALAQYFGGEAQPLSPLDETARMVAEGDLLYGEALDALMNEALGRAENRHLNVADLEKRIGAELADAVERVTTQAAITAAGGTIAKVRPDMDPRLADRLGIDPGRQLTEGEIGNLLAGTRADANPIKGKQVHKPRISVAEAFGLDEKVPPQGEAVRNVLAGKRADGEAPRSANGEALSQAAINGARKRFLATMDVPGSRDATPEEVEHLVAGRTARGLSVVTGDYRQQVSAIHAPVAYVEFVFAPDKTVSMAWALAPTEAERAAVLQVHNDAVAGALAHAEHLLGHVGIGKNRSGGSEPARMAWLTFNHFTSRPTVELVAHDAEGRPYTEPREVPVAAAMQVHTHSVLFNALLTESGRVGSMDLDRLNGSVKEIGGVYQAFVAQGARALGADVVLDERTGAARLASVPETARALFSSRHNEGEAAARAYAAKEGLDWDALGEPQKRALLEAGSIATRRPKGAGQDGEGINDFVGWEKRALDAGYRHRSILRPDDIPPGLSPQQRRDRAYEMALPLIEDALSRSAKLGQADLREIATRGLIVAGIGNPAEDIEAVTRAFVQRGVRQDGQQTALLVAEDVPLRGKARIAATTALHAGQEAELVDLARKAHADRSGALSPARIARAADRSGLDFTTDHGRAQRAMMEDLATGGRLAVAIGAAGSGKTSVLGPIVSAWKEAGTDRTVFGATLAWKQSAGLVDAGIDPQNSAALDPFLKRAEGGKYALDRNSLVVIDEIGQVGTRQLLGLLRLQEKHGFKLIAVGDPAQCQAVEAGPVITLLQRALGEDAIPAVLTSVRQKTEREREIAGLFREGHAAKALAMKREDGTARLVAGGSERTVQAVADLWRERMEANKANPAFKLTVTAPTNDDVHRIGVEVRKQQRAMGLLGEDAFVVKAVADRRTRQAVEMPLAVGDRVRVFKRVFDDTKKGAREVLASNGDIVEIRELSRAGMVVRNEAGAEGLVKWDKLRAEQGGPIRLAYGAALTIDAAQGITSTENINAMLGGTSGVTGFKNYVAESRHRDRTWMVIDEAAERREVHARRPLGSFALPTQADVWANVARNLSRQPEKASALDLLTGSLDRKREMNRTLQLGLEPAERRKRTASLAPRMVSLPEWRRMSLPHVVERVRGMVRAAQERMVMMERQWAERQQERQRRDGHSLTL